MKNLGDSFRQKLNEPKKNPSVAYMDNKGKILRALSNIGRMVHAAYPGVNTGWAEVNDLADVLHQLGELGDTLGVDIEE